MDHEQQVKLCQGIIHSSQLVAFPLMRVAGALQDGLQRGEVARRELLKDEN